MKNEIQKGNDHPDARNDNSCVREEGPDVLNEQADVEKQKQVHEEKE